MKLYTDTNPVCFCPNCGVGWLLMVMVVAVATHFFVRCSACGKVTQARRQELRGSVGGNSVLMVSGEIDNDVRLPPLVAGLEIGL